MENENLKRNELVNINKEEEKKHSGGIRKIFSRFLKFIGRIIKKGNRNYLNIVKEGMEPIKVNLTITVIFFVVAFWAAFIILVAGLFFGYRYYIDGEDCRKSRVNDYLGKAADMVEDVKNEFKDGYKNA